MCLLLVLTFFRGYCVERSNVRGDHANIMRPKMKNTGSDETMLVPGLGLVGLLLFYSAVRLRCYDMNGCHQWVSSSSLGVSDETPSSVAMMAALGTT